MEESHPSAKFHIETMTVIMRQRGRIGNAIRLSSPTDSEIVALKLD